MIKYDKRVGLTRLKWQIKIEQHKTKEKLIYENVMEKKINALFVTQRSTLEVTKMTNKRKILFFYLFVHFNGTTMGGEKKDCWYKTTSNEKK